MPKVSVQPLLAQHRDECGQQRHQQARVQEVGGCDDFLGRSTPDRGSGGILVRGNGSVEVEEDRSEVGFGPFARVWLELGLDVDGEGGTDRGEQASLKLWSTRVATNGIQTRTKIKVVFLVVFLHVFGIVFHCLSFVHGVEIELGVVVLDGLEVHP